MSISEYEGGNNMNYPLIYLLSENYETLATFSNELPGAMPVISDFYEGNIDDNSFMVEITTVLTHPRASEIKIGRHIYYPTNDSGEKKIFRIVEIQEERNESYKLTFKAELTVIGDLLEQIVRPISFSGESVEEIMKHFLIDTQWNVKIKDEIPSVDYEVSNYITSLEAIRGFAEEIGATIDYEYVFEGLNVVGRNVVLYKESSQDVSLFVSKDRDLQSIKRIVDSSNVITSIIGIGGEGTNGEKVTLAQLQEITEIPEGFAHEYGSDFLDHVESIEKSPTKRYGILTDSECKTPQQLLEKCIEKLEEMCVPTVKYEVEFSLFDRLENIALGKKVFINDMTVNPKIALSGNIRQIRTSIYNKADNKVVLGNYITYDTELDETIKDMQDKLDKEEAENNKNSYSIKINNIGGTTFVNGEGETLLIIEVYKKGREIDVEGSMFDYTWTRLSETGQPIPLIGTEGTTLELKQKTITILGSTVEEAKKINLKGSVKIKI